MIAELGEGGFGKVWHVEYGTTPISSAALKMLRPDLVQNPLYKSRFDTENDLLHQLIGHAGVINPYTKVIEHQGQPYYLMELADYDLQKFSDMPSTTTDEKLEVFFQICEAIKAAHDLGVVHRDMHYGNVLIKRENSLYAAKLTDFGIAKVFTSGSDDLYTPGRQWGRMDTRAPETYFFLEEVADFNSYTIKSDLYGLGMILYFLLNGMPYDYAFNITSSIRRYMNNAGVLEGTSRNSLDIPLFTASITNDQKKVHYDEWLKSRFIPNNYDFDVFANGLTEERALKFQAVITKSCNIDSSKRYNNVSELIAEVRAI